MAYCTSLETIDISIDEALPQNSEQETIEPTVEENRNQESTLEKGKKKERSKKDLEKIVFATGCLREPVINSPADIYKHFPRWVTFEDELRKRVSETESSISGEIGSKENASYSDDQFFDDNAVRPSPNTNKTGTSDRGKTVEKYVARKHLKK